jgi:hypothetical protein
MKMENLNHMENNQLPLQPYPEELFDEHGYPTEEALNYIDNWGSREIDGKLFYGEKFVVHNYEELIEYVLSIWTYGKDALIWDGKLLEIHTLGWSGNEEILPRLKNTALWLLKFRAQEAGGHYYFNVNDKEYTFRVQKVEKEW